jgi:hypothetical protein
MAQSGGNGVGLPFSLAHRIRKAVHAWGGESLRGNGWRRGETAGSVRPGVATVRRRRGG